MFNPLKLYPICDGAETSYADRPLCETNAAFRLCSRSLKPVQTTKQFMKPSNYLRPTANLSLFGAFLFMLYGASYRPQTTAAGIVDHFKVGDVVYSLLAPADFIRLHGNRDRYGNTIWRLLDGETLRETDDLRKSFSSQLRNFVSVPDARGVFIRCMNLDQDTFNGDEGGNRVIGSYQRDDIKSHTHPWTAELERFGGGNNLGEDGDGTSGLNLISPRVTGSFGGRETRPRNITLYAYIKVTEY
jgi:hypothetical protein